MNIPANRDAVAHQRHDRGEARIVVGVVVGAVDGVDDPDVARPVEALQHGRVGRRRFLADRCRAGQRAGQCVAQKGFALLVGHGDEIVGARFRPNIGAREVAELRQHDGPGGLAQDAVDSIEIGQGRGTAAVAGPCHRTEFAQNVDSVCWMQAGPKFACRSIQSDKFIPGPADLRRRLSRPIRSACPVYAGRTVRCRQSASCPFRRRSVRPRRRDCKARR